MPGQTYSLAQFVREVNSLGTGTVYPYASLSGHSSSSCKLVSIDSDTGAIKFVRNGGTQIEKISSANVSKLVEALSTCKAVEMNALFGGSGNARSALEAFVVHTPHVYLCKINGKKHIYYSSEKQHSSGQIEIDTNPSVPVYSGIDTGRKTDDLGLVVGMQSEESPYGVVTIIDDDDYSYQVLCVNDSKHSKGIRTISKILVKEWISAVTGDPTKNASTIRDDLCGKSDIDKFEYGNEGVLIKLAKMAVGQAPHSIIDVSEYWNRRLGRSEKAILPPVDLLSIALKMFDEERKASDKHNKYADFARTWFADYTPQKLKDNFATFQRDLIWSGMVRAQVTKDYAHVDKLADLLDELKKDPRPLAYYLGDEFKAKMDECPGIGISTIVDMLMKMHPDEYCAYTDMMHDSLKKLGLLPADASTKLNSENYRRAMGLYEEIRQRMIQMGIHLTRGENTDDPDFLTVNSFLWFVKENFDLIKEEVMKKQWKPVNSQAKKKTGSRKLSNAFANDDMLKRLAAALRTKPFAILAGHSGTGKSQLVRRLAYMTCNNELLAKEGEDKTAPGNYCMVQVKPNWHDSTDLLGYYSEMGERHFVNTPFVEFICKAYAYPDTPFFVCLDEMNLAPVEQYFAEYLSAIESMEKKGNEWLTDPLVEVDKTGEKDENGKEKVNPEIVDQIMKGAASTEAAAWIQTHGLTIPKNLFVVGTVNMDETTCQFSRKVLDRAMTLLMNEVKFGSMSQSKKPSEEELLDDDGLNFFLEGGERGDVGETESKLLDGINEPLANTAFVVAYRFANEYALYEAAWAKLTGVDLAAVEPAKKEELATKALDHVVLMKLLPRIHGERRAVEGIFKGRKVKGPDGDKDLPGLKTKVPGGLSAEMMDKILARSDEYLTFWP